MMTMMSTHLYLSAKITLLSKVCSMTLLSALILTGCGTGSGESTQPLPNTGAATTNTNYTGPAPATNDVQNFKLSLWDNLVSTQRCGACHSTGGQIPTFVDDQNINTAYAQANGVVNLADPSQSLMVTKVAGGHNCWLASAAACADTLTRYIENWAGGSAGTIKQITLRAPAIKDPGASKPFPDDSAQFSSTIYPLVREYCSECHVEGVQTPFFASANVATAYAAAQSKIDLATPADSRLVLRLRNEFHNCWDSDCPSAASEMQSVIEAFANTLPLVQIDPDLITSKALSLAQDGLLANAGGRYEDHIIALYEFKTGEGSIAYDTSGVEPALNLTLSGNVSWVGGWGIHIGPAYVDETLNRSIGNGKAQGTTTSSKKLHGLITAFGEYSIEAWVAPGNVTQEEARIITYSGASTARNFTLGQTLYNYDFLQRSSTTDQNQALSTADADERLQASLQHVVITFSPGSARKIYVNGEYTGDLDPSSAGNLSEWDDSYALVLGNETDGNSLWQGTLRLVAIHNRALTDAQIQQNYSVGVGEKFLLLFNVSHLINLPDSFFVFEASQLDSYSYLFAKPFFIRLNDSARPPALPNNILVQRIKLGINGKEAAVGQAYRNLNLTLNETDYVPGSGQMISTLGTVIALEKGPNNDEFFLIFERLGEHSNVHVEAAPPVVPEPADLEPSADIGLKTFDEINASMSAMTGVAQTHPAVAATFATVKQQLPTSEMISGFVSAQQMGITQLAIQYCDALIEDTALRTRFFPGVEFTASVTNAFTPAGREQVITPLLSRLVGSHLSTQPADEALVGELNDLLDRLTSCGNDCASDRTETVIKSACAAVLGSATTLIQ